MKKSIIMGLAAVVLLVVIGYFVYFYNKGTLSYISISINPDVELAINNSGVVEEVVAVNDDADILLADLDLVGMSFEEASERIVDEAIEVGFIDEYSDQNEVIVTVNNEDETIRSDLEEKVITRLNNKFQEKKVYPVVVSMGINDDIREEAADYGISANKMLFIERVVAINPALNKEDLVDMKINEIQQLIREYVASRHEVMKQTRAELKNAWKKEKEELKEKIQIKRQDLRNKIIKEANINPNDMTNDQKQEFIENALNTRKEALKNQTEAVKERLKEKTYNSYSSIKESINSIRSNIRNSQNETQ